MPYYPENVVHSKKYCDTEYEYKHVILPKSIFKKMPRNRFLSESEIKQLGVIQSKGWEQYTIFKNEPYVLLFRRRFKG